MNEKSILVTSEGFFFKQDHSKFHNFQAIWNLLIFSFSRNFVTLGPFASSFLFAFNPGFSRFLACQKVPLRQIQQATPECGSRIPGFSHNVAISVGQLHHLPYDVFFFFFKEVLARKKSSYSLWQYWAFYLLMNLMKGLLLWRRDNLKFTSYASFSSLKAI